MPNIFDTDLPKTAANYAAQSPLAFIERTAEVYPDKLAVVHGNLRQTWLETFTRCRQRTLPAGSSAGQRRGILQPGKPGEVTHIQ